MASLSTGGGTSAVAASTHAGCERFRRTDPMIIGTSRRNLAETLGHPDTTASIPEARRMRANIFERLVRAEHFVSPLITKAVGAIDLRRPTAVRRAQCGINKATTALALASAHEFAMNECGATLLTDLAVPFVGLENEPGATAVKPDFAVVTPRFDDEDDEDPSGSWLIMGDAKDYERVRTKIADQRMLKGFLQVALGAESIEAWSELPDDMEVHTWGALAVPRNAFLQPEPVVEDLVDHRREVQARVAERTALLRERGSVEFTEDELPGFVEHLVATFDPATCTTCSMLRYCKDELRRTGTSESLLIEIGVRAEARRALLDVVEGKDAPVLAPASEVARVRSSITGVAERTGKRRTDFVGEPGTLNVVLAKSDSAALGVYGIGWQVVDGLGAPGDWSYQVFENAQAPTTRLHLMSIVGEGLAQAMEGSVQENAARPAHIVVPDQVTGDVLSSIADSIAGVELSRIRWQRDLDEGREALTFGGEPASVPPPISDHQRLAVSLLLEEDRARTMTLRSVLVNLRTVVSEHLIVGGPTFEVGRLDYLLRWARSGESVDFRKLSDEIADQDATPGARLSNRSSDAIHRASTGGDRPSPVEYERQVLEALQYRTAVVDEAVDFLKGMPTSATRGAYRAIEADAQEVWRRRYALQASDLVRFGRTYRHWRNDQVELLDAHAGCSQQLDSLQNPRLARDFATDAGTRNVALAHVRGLDPILLEVGSRRIVAGSKLVLLGVNGAMSVEQDDVTVTILGGSFKFGSLSIGYLSDHGDGLLEWRPSIPPTLSVGDELIVASGEWFANADFRSGHEASIKRPGADTTSAPKADCSLSSYESDPEAHKWCCRSHLIGESEWSDELARRRANGELNPEVWPPVVDEDEFDTLADGSPTSETIGADPDASSEYDDMTMDDLE